jgi:SP family myo-inositol transporter-like MFS transporter 13
MAHYDLSYDANSSDSEESHRFISSQTADDNSLKTIGTSFRAHPDYNKCRIWFYLSLLSLFSATGGFLFGYDTGVVSGAMIKIDEHFSLSAEWHEVIVASTIGAAAVASIASGIIAEWIGRKPLLLMASCVFTIGAGIMAGSVHPIMLLSGRVIVGLGIGAAAMGVPMYIAESAPTHMRGKLVVMNSLFLTGGQFIATVIDGAFSNVDEGWR